MRYRIDYVYDDGYRGRSNKVHFFEEKNDDIALKQYQDFQKKCENSGGLVSWDECTGLVRINSDGSTTKII